MTILTLPQTFEKQGFHRLDNPHENIFVFKHNQSGQIVTLHYLAKINRWQLLGNSRLQSYRAAQKLVNHQNLLNSQRDLEEGASRNITELAAPYITKLES